MDQAVDVPAGQKEAPAEAPPAMPLAATEETRHGDAADPPASVEAPAAPADVPAHAAAGDGASELGGEPAVAPTQAATTTTSAACGAAEPGKDVPASAAPASANNLPAPVGAAPAAAESEAGSAADELVPAAEESAPLEVSPASGSEDAVSRSRRRRSSQLGSGRGPTRARKPLAKPTADAAAGQNKGAAEGGRADPPSGTNVLEELEAQRRHHNEQVRAACRHGAPACPPWTMQLITAPSPPPLAPQLLLEGKVRQELESMLARIEGHVHAEQAARLQAEEGLAAAAAERDMLRAALEAERVQQVG